MSREEKSDEVKDRLAGRFDDTADEEEEHPDKSDNLVKSDNPDNSASPATTDNLDKSENPNNSASSDATDNLDNAENRTIDPKEDWTGRMVYVPGGEAGTEDILDTFDGEYDRFQYECDWDIRKQLHYYPVLVTHGILELEEMNGDEFTEAVDELGLRSR